HIFFFLYLFFFSSYLDLRYLHSFPTRRSSDLVLHFVERVSVVFHFVERFSVALHFVERFSVALHFVERFSVVLHFVERFSVVLRSEEHTSELQSRSDLVCRLLLEKKKKKLIYI